MILYVYKPNREKLKYDKELRHRNIESRQNFF